MQTNTARDLRILIADDSNTERVNLSLILRRAGHQVLATQSGNEAIAQTKLEKPDMVLLDIIMQDGDGFKACRSIKQDPNTQGIPVIMVSSKSNPVDREWAKKQGATAYIQKPYTSEDILAEVNKIRH